MMCIKCYYNFISFQLAVINPTLKDHSEGMLSELLLKEGVRSMDNTAIKDNSIRAAQRRERQRESWARPPRVQGHEFQFRLHCL